LGETPTPLRWGRCKSPRSRAAASTISDRRRKTLRVRLAVVLRYRNEVGLRDLIAASKHIDAATFRAKFAPSAATYASTIAALAASGLSIDRTYANRTVINVSGSPQTVDRAFTTQIDAVRDTDGAVRSINVRPASVPPALRDTVYGVVGFDARRLIQAAYRLGPHNAALAGNNRGVPIAGPDGGFSPTILAQAYDYPIFQPHVPRYDGTGQAAAIVIDADFLDSDLTGCGKTSQFGLGGTGIVGYNYGKSPRIFLR
jgi:hypothetical protein